MTEADIKSVINEAMVKDNINADLSQEFSKKLETSFILQEFPENIKTMSESLIKQPNTNSVVSGIVRQVSGKKIQIPLRQLLKMVRPEVKQDITNSISDPNISRHKRPSCINNARKVNKATVDSSSSSSSGSESSSDSSSDNECTLDVYAEKAKKRN